MEWDMGSVNPGIRYKAHIKEAKKIVKYNTSIKMIGTNPRGYGYQEMPYNLRDCKNERGFIGLF